MLYLLIRFVETDFETGTSSSFNDADSFMSIPTIEIHKERVIYGALNLLIKTNILKSIINCLKLISRSSKMNYFHKPHPKASTLKPEKFLH